MFSRTFVRASNTGDQRRRMRQQRRSERKLALQGRWYVGGLATLVAGSLVFSGMSPAAAEEVSDQTTTAQSVTTESTDASTPPAAEEPAAEEPAAEAPPAEEPPAEAPPAEAPPAEPPGAEEPTADDPGSERATADEPEMSTMAAPLDVSALALVCDGWPAAGSPVAGFEIDGNLCLDGDGTKDWATVGGQPVRSDGFDDATQFTGGSKESNWPWSGAQISGSGTAPAKTDMGNIYAYTQTVAGNVYAYLGFQRQVNNGSVSYHVELNQLANTMGPVPNRTEGDLRLTIEQNGNNTIALVGADTWDASEGEWVSLGSLAGFVGQVNQDVIEDLSGAQLEDGIFAEASVNLTALFGDAGCSGNFGVINVRSSSSPEETSSLGDWINPISANVPSTCSTLTIRKTDPSGNPLADADFSITPNPTTGTGSTTGTTDASGTIVFSGNVQPGSYTVVETDAPAGYLLDATPQQVTFGDQAESKTLTFVDPLGSVTWVKHDRSGQLLGGATFQITATGGDAAAAPWAAAFPKTVVDNGLNDADPDAGEFLVQGLPTGSYQVAETVAPANYVLDSTPRSFTVSDQTPHPSIAVPFVNTPFATVTLSKVWVDAFAGDEANLSIGGAAAANGTSTAPTNGQVVQVSVAPGSALTLSEVLPGGNTGLYTSTLSCVGAPVSNNTGTGGAVTVPAYPASAAGVQCTFTNTAVRKTVTLQKHWLDAIAGDTAELHAGPATATSTANGTADQEDGVNIAQTSVRVGDVVALSEVLAGVGSYGSTYDCTAGETTGDGSGTEFSLTVPNANVTCTFTNTADRATVTLTKQWVDAFAGDEAELSITGAETDAATSVATEGDSTDAAHAASVEVRVGQKVTLSEELADGNTGEYITTWSCSDGSSGQGGGIPEITVTADVDCTIVNTAKEITLTLDKRWVDAFAGDVATLSVDGSAADSTADGSLTQLDDDVVTVSVRVGDEVNIHEELDSDANTGEYESIYSCTAVVNGMGQGRDFDFVAPDADVNCTFTNTAIKVGVVLQKRWIAGLLGDETELGLTTEAGVLLTKLSQILGVTTFTDDTNTIEVLARIGAVLPLRETIAEDAVGLYDSTYNCLGGGEVSGTGVGTAFELTVTAATSIDGKIRCLFVNQARSATVHLVKTWVNGQEGDSAHLSISGIAPATATSVSNGDVGPWTDVENAIEKQALIGAEVTVSELIEVAAGEASDYDSTLVCLAADQSVLLTVDARTGTFTMPDGSVWCEFTNTAERPTLALVKLVDVVGAEVSDTNWQLFGTPELGDVVTNPAGGDVEPTPVLPGDAFGLDEDVIGDVTGIDEFEPGEWSCVSDDAGAIELTDSEPGSASLRGLDKGEHVVCTIVNSHVDQGYTFDKEFVSSVQHEDGSWTVTYDITVHNNSVLVPIVYDLTDTLATPAEGVAYTGATWTGPTSGDFLGSLTAQLADDEELAPFTGSNDAVYTVAVDVEVSALPDDPDVCDEGGDGIGIVNTAWLTAGEDEPVDAVACGTVHFDDVDIEKTASNLPESGSVEPGDSFDYVLTVSNNGTRDAVDVVVSDPIPARLEVTGVALPAGWVNDNDPDLVDGDNVLQVSAPLLEVGETVDIVVTVTFTATEVPPVEPGDGSEVPPPPLEELANTACVDADRDQVEENNCDTIEIPVREITALVYSKCVGDAPFLGWTITKSQTLINEEIHFLWTPDSGTATTDPAQVAITHPGGTATWSQEIEWPGAEFTPSGVSIDYPGWRPIRASDIVPGSTPTQYYHPGTTDIMTAAEQLNLVFNGLILDDSELDYAWRLASTVTFQVNPEMEFHTGYPAATPTCFVARHSEVQIEKTASVQQTASGASYTYDLAVENVSDDSAAEAVVVTDVIPSQLKITSVTWPGKGDAAVFPNWTTCAVSGQDASGYGGKLSCELFGPLQPAGAGLGPSAAPTITLAATVNPASTSSSITNVAVVDYHTFGDPDDPGRDADDATVLLSALPATGGELPPMLVILGLLALLAGTSLMVVTRRRRGELKLTA